VNSEEKIRAIKYFENEIFKLEKQLSQIPVYIGIGLLLLILSFILYFFVFKLADSHGTILHNITFGIAIVGGIVLFGGMASFLFDNQKGEIEKHQSHIKQIEREIDEAKGLMKKGGVDNLKQAIKTFEKYLSHEETPQKIPVGAFYILAPGSSYKSNNEGLGALFGD